MPRKRHLSVLVIGSTLWATMATVAHTQDAAYPHPEPKRVIAKQPLEDMAGWFETTAVANAGDGGIMQGSITNYAGIKIQLFNFRPSAEPELELADLIGPSDRTEVLVTLTGGAPDLLSPDLIAEVHEGSCADRKPAMAGGNSPSAYSLTPSALSLGSFSAILPVSLAALRTSAHALTVRFAQETRNSTLACVDIG
jgi:hypothetical protein